jgi:pantoate--beta-alanine ligase
MSSRNVYLGGRRRAVGLVLHDALRAAEAAFESGKRDREEILGAATRVAAEILNRQKGLPPSQRALFDVDYISLADPESLEEVNVVDPSKGAILSGAIKMLPIEEPQQDEDLGVGGSAIPVRLIDNIILPTRN